MALCFASLWAVGILDDLHGRQRREKNIEHVRLQFYAVQAQGIMGGGSTVDRYS